MNKKSVKALLETRVKEKSTPTSRSDGARIGLVVEGGGMRGVISGAMVAALENMGMSNAFDAVYGASAGAMAAAFFVSGNASAGATVYYEEINNRRFVNPWRLLSTKPVLDLDFLVYDIFDGKVPLDFDRIISSQTKLCVVATEVKEARKQVFSDFSSKASILESLKASASNPLITGSPVIIDGRGYWDAILSESIPIQSAVEDGCTHYVILRSRPVNEKRSATGKIEASLAKFLMKGHGSRALEAYCSKDRAYEQELTQIGELGEESLVVAPTPGTKVSQTSANRDKLLSAAKDGYQNTIRAFGIHDATVNPKIGHYQLTGKK